MEERDELSSVRSLYKVDEVLENRAGELDFIQVAVGNPGI